MTNLKILRLFRRLHLRRVFGKSIDVSFTRVQEIQKINSPVFACFANTQENEVFP
jgi:hypothetical protein